MFLTHREPRVGGAAYQSCADVESAGNKKVFSFSEVSGKKFINVNFLLFFYFSFKTAFKPH